jgi:glutamate/aspartate transport system substrate-binding protein
MKAVLKIALLAWALGAAPAGAQQLYGTLKKVKESGVFTIGHREASYPFAYYDDNKKPAGFAVDLCERVAEAVKKELSLPNLEIRYLPVNPQTRIPLLTNGTIDIECGSTTNNLTRQQQVDFTHIMYVTGTRLLVSKKSRIKEVEDLKGKVAAVAQGTTNEKIIRELIEKLGINTKLIYVKDHSEGMLALETGRIDAYVHDEVGEFALLAKSRKKDELAVVGRLLSYDPYGLMVRRDDSAYRLVANRMLSDLFRTGEINAIFKKWFDPVGIPMTDEVKAAFRLQALPY